MRSGSAISPMTRSCPPQRGDGKCRCRKRVSTAAPRGEERWEGRRSELSWVWSILAWWSDRCPGSRIFVSEVGLSWIASGDKETIEWRGTLQCTDHAKPLCDEGTFRYVKSQSTYGTKVSGPSRDFFRQPNSIFRSSRLKPEFLLQSARRAMKSLERRHCFGKVSPRTVVVRSTIPYFGTTTPEVFTALRLPATSIALQSAV